MPLFFTTSTLMNFREDIEKWNKSGCDWSTGFKLLEALIADTGFKSSKLIIIRSGKSSFTQKLLKSEIEAALAALPVSKEVAAPKVFGSIDTSTFPDDLKKLYAQTIENLKEMDVLRGRLQEVHYDDAGKHRRSPDEKRAAAIAEQIHNLFIKNRDAWARLDYFKEYGKYLPGTEPTALDVDRLIYLLSMQVKVKDYLYKARVKIQKGKTINTTLYNQYLSIEAEINSIINAKI